jgi:hypothetical protein
MILNNKGKMTLAIDAKPNNRIEEIFTALSSINANCPLFAHHLCRLGIAKGGDHSFYRYILIEGLMLGEYHSIEKAMKRFNLTRTEIDLCLIRLDHYSKEIVHYILWPYFSRRPDELRNILLYTHRDNWPYFSKTIPYISICEYL